jgi:RNA polymerase sigma factor (sigma-70 family)
VPHGPVVETLLERGFSVHAVNPKQLDRFRDRFTVAGAKDDRRDAHVLADALRTDGHCFLRLGLADPLVIELREWSRMADELQQERNRLANRVREQLWRYYPQALQLGEDVAAAWFLELWSLAPTPAKGARLRESSVARLLKTHRIRRLEPGAVLRLLRQMPLAWRRAPPRPSHSLNRMRGRKPQILSETFSGFAHLMGMMDATLTTAPADDLPDSQLVTLVRQGEGAAFREIMRRNNRRLFRLVRAIVGDDLAAEDIVQETYVRAFAGLAGWRGDASLSTWLSRIALNEALTQARRGRHTIAFEEAAEAPATSTTGAFDHLQHPSPEAIVAHAEIRRLLERAIDDLAPQFRTVFMLRAVEQLSVEETAAALGIPSETVRTRFLRARRRLSRALGQQLAHVLEGTFPFAGARCDRIMTKVLQRLAISPEQAPTTAVRGANPSMLKP